MLGDQAHPLDAADQVGDLVERMIESDAALQNRHHVKLS